MKPFQQRLESLLKKISGRDEVGIDEILITISHCKAYATATAIGIRNDL